MRPSQALSPGLSVSEAEPIRRNSLLVLNVVESFPGAKSPLGSKEPNEQFSHLIGSLLFKHRIDASGEFSGHRHDRFSRRPIARVALVNRAVELPKFRVLSDGRPSRLDQFTAKPPVPTARDVPARHSRSPVERSVGTRPMDTRPLAHITDLLRIADTSQKVAGHDLANPRNAFEMSHRLAKLWVLLIEAANLFDRLNHPLLGRLQAFHELIKLKAHRRRARNFFQFSLTMSDHWLPAGAGGN